MVVQKQEKKTHLFFSTNYKSEHLNPDFKTIFEIMNMNRKINIFKDMGKSISHVTTTSKNREENLIMKKQRNLKIFTHVQSFMARAWIPAPPKMFVESIEPVHSSNRQTKPFN